MAVSSEVPLMGHFFSCWLLPAPSGSTCPCASESVPTPIAQTLASGVLGELVVTGVRSLSPTLPAQERTVFLQVTL